MHKTSIFMAKARFLSSLLIISLLTFYFFYLGYFNHFTPASVHTWLRENKSTSFLRHGFHRKHCHVVAMVLASEQDVNNGSMTDWAKTIPKSTETPVCCVFIRRSRDVQLRFIFSDSSCDTMFVPMVREDKYLTISEKVMLGLKHISSMYKFKWLLKTDTDSYVCFSRLLRLVRNFDSRGIIHMGYAESRNILLEDPRHRWYDPSITDIVHNHRQPVVSGIGLYHPYMQGAGYVLSQGAVSRLESIMPDLRYSPMEDAMMGCWLLALNAHYAVLDLDLRGERGDCNLPSHLYISHYRKGKKAFDTCRSLHPECTAIQSVKNVDVHDVSFLITSNVEERGNQCLDAYNSIRAMFPRNEIIFGDVSNSHEILKRLLKTSNDDNLRGLWYPRASSAEVRNELVSHARSKYVVMLTDEQRVSWETMIGRMVEPIQYEEADISAGFFKFNPQMNDSAVGLYALGAIWNKHKGILWRDGVKLNLKPPNATAWVNETTGFIVAKRSFLMENEWRNFGRFTDDEWHFRLNEKQAKMILVNSGVRHGYHYALAEKNMDVDKVKKFGRQFCAVLKRERLYMMRGPHERTDCAKGILRRTVGNATFIRW